MSERQGVIGTLQIVSGMLILKEAAATQPFELSPCRNVT